MKGIHLEINQIFFELVTEIERLRSVEENI